VEIVTAQASSGKRQVQLAEDVLSVGKSLGNIAFGCLWERKIDYDIKIDRGRGKLSTKDQGFYRMR
jgi:hypothetical protein